MNARQMAALLPRLHDQASVIRSTATVSGLSVGPVGRRAPVVGREDDGLRDKRLGPTPSRITVVPLGVGLYKPPGKPMQRVRTQIEIDLVT